MKVMVGMALTSSVFLHPEPDAFLIRLRQLPGLGRLLPTPQPVLAGGVFRVTIRPAPISYFCPTGACYWAVVPDAESFPKIGRLRGLGL